MTLPSLYSKDNPSLWKYVGPGEYHGRIHAVAMADSHEIVTLGLGNGGKPDHSWLGSPYDFVKHFVFAGGGEP